MLQNIGVVGGPECESLGFNHLIDGYRQYTGPANLAQKRLVSTECGAISGEAYQQTIPEWLWDAKRSFAGSVTQFIIHGFPYSGSYGNTTWPGWSTFDYAFSDMHGPRMPAWEFYKETSRLAISAFFYFPVRYTEDECRVLPIHRHLPAN